MNEIFNTIISSANAMLPIEATAVVLSLVYVFLAAKRNIWCWPVGFVACSIYVYLCWKGQLYVETILQSYYVLMAVYGWITWSTHPDNLERPIQVLTLQQHIKLIIGGGVTAACVGYIFINYTNAAIPYLDSFTTIFSFIATWMVARKILENWLYWIVIDFASIFLYASREYYLSSALYLAYTVIAIWGYLAWKKTYQGQLALHWSDQNPVAKPH